MILEVIKRRTKSENVSVEFDEEQGKTNGRMVAEAETPMAPTSSGWSSSPSRLSWTPTQANHHRLRLIIG